MTWTDTAATAAVRTGLVIRRFRGEADVEEIVRIRNADWEADGVRERWSVAEARPYFGNPSEHFDPARDVRIAELDGRPVAVTWTEWVDTNDGLREYWSRGYVAPEARRRGIGAALLTTNIERIRALAATHDTDRPKVLGLGTAQNSIGGPILARRHRYEPVRWFFDMERSLIEPLPEIPPLPDGLEVRPVGRDDARALWAADHDAFRDHWGGFDDSDAAFRRWLESPDFAPDLFVVAFDGGEIAGAVLNAIYPEENAQLGIRRGWLDSVFTRRAWRRRGLARALIVRSLHLLRERGMEIAALGVDADNPSGALGLYGSVGFAEVERMTAWRRPLEVQS
jgi:mycothiol synthase